MGYHKEESYHQRFFSIHQRFYQEFQSPVKCAMYADDLVLWSTEAYATTAKIRLQEATNSLSSWAQDWCVKINKLNLLQHSFPYQPNQNP